MNKLINDLHLSVQYQDNFDIYNNIRKTLVKYNFEDLLKICVNYIIDKNIIPIKIDGTNNFYDKFLLFENKEFSIVLIKWNKNTETKIHDHPSKGCVLRLLSGKLNEEIYTSKLVFLKTNILNLDNISYRIGNNIIHKIIAIEDSISLHIYVPGYYKPNLY
jgi:hypothetical protein